MALRLLSCLLACLCATGANTVSKKTAVSKPSGTSQVRRWMSGLSLRQEVAQLIVVQFYGDLPRSRSKEYREYERLIRKDGIGGLIILNRIKRGVVVNAEPFAMAAFLNRMQRMASIPLIVGGDFERGASMRVSGTVKFPHSMAYGAANDIDGTRFLARQTARESRALGVHWVFAPDADVNNNADNPVINLRSFGENPELVASHVRAYVEGAHSDPTARVLVCAKHFPGHGDTAVDTHMGLASVTGDRERLNQVELKPFVAAIDAGVDSIMSAHLTIPAIEPEEIPATVSPRVLTTLLKGELGFKGIVTTDAMDMDGLAKQFPNGEAAVRAIEAGVDVLLIPPNADAAIDAVVKAVESGRIPRSRIRTSLEKVLAAKVKLGLAAKRLVDVEMIAETIADPEALQQAQATAERALTLVRNERQVFPVTDPDRSCLYALSENKRSVLGRTLVDEVKDRAQRMSALWLDASLPDAAFADIAASAATCNKVYIATFAAASAARGGEGLALSPPLTKFVNALLAGPAPVGLISFGNPYLLRAFPQVAGYVATFSTAQVSEQAMTKALFGEISYRGKLPVTIPGIAAYGAGLTQ